MGVSPNNANRSLSYDDFVSMMAELTINEYIPPRFLVMMEGNYELRDDGHWWFQKGPAPVWWRYPISADWSKAYAEWSVNTPWVRCESANPMNVVENPDRLPGLVEAMRRTEADMSEFMVEERFRR